MMVVQYPNSKFIFTNQNLADWFKSYTCVI